MRGTLNNMSTVKKIILPLALSILLSGVATLFLIQWFELNTMIPEVLLAFSIGQKIKLFITCLLYFTTLITLPFLIKDLAQKLKLKKGDWWKGLLALEILAVIFSYLSTPPDLISTVLFILICQPIVVVNVVVLNRKLAKFDQNK
jgi:hypothetical protein